ncbi:radical SAM protein [Candidatus Woesearchaeota archaeon]|nr:radical SAM protein [Candidatus Woesearchaeota archaeon]
MQYMISKSSDGTIKITFKEGFVSVIIPTIDEKYAVCVSSQLGCPVGCSFCFTGKRGFKRNLTKEEMMKQIETVMTIIGKIPNSVVFMGMGEPTLNLENVLEAAEEIHKKYSIAYVRITISTSCLKNLNKLLNIPFNLALSVHSVDEKTRKKIMPKSVSTKTILNFANKYFKIHPKKYLMIEYALMKGINDSEKDIEKLTKIKWPKRTLFNFIQFNEIGKFKQVNIERMREFKQAMRDAGYKAFIRQNRGSDIKAACGMLDYK